jgi:N-acetylmuramoyl-L-alanine amidase
MEKNFRGLGRKNAMFIGIFFAVGLIVFASVMQFYGNPLQSASMIPVSGKRIVLDPGHGGPDGGATSRSGLLEEEVALKITHYLRDYLQEAGALVIMTRETDTDLAKSGTRGFSKRKAEDLVNRIQLIEQKNADILISVHLNSIPSPRWKGAQTFYNPIREENKKLASCVQFEMIHNLQNTDRLPERKGDVYILKYSPIPTALVEVGFLSNPDEARMLGSVAYQKKIAAAIYYGIIGYYSGKEPPIL